MHSAATMFSLYGEATRQYFISILIITYRANNTLGMTVPVYTQENTTDAFLYTTGLPAMERFSVCFWMFGVPDDDDRKEDALFSIAVPGAPNEFYLNFPAGNKGLRVKQADSSGFFPEENSTSLDARFLGWKQHCFSMACGQMFKWYTRSSEPGSEIMLWNSIEVGGEMIRPNGSLVFLQDQDKHDGNSQLGGFMISETIEARIALFSMWDYELTYEEFRDVNCLTNGNLLNMDDLSIMGPANLTLEDVPCASVTRPEMSDKHGVIFKKLGHYNLQGCKIMSIQAVSKILRCVSYCAANTDCFSVNYYQPDGTCMLNGYNNMLSIDNIDANYTHYSLLL